MIAIRDKVKMISAMIPSWAITPYLESVYPNLISRMRRHTPLMPIAAHCMRKRALLGNLWVNFDKKEGNCKANIGIA